MAGRLCFLIAAAATLATAAHAAPPPPPCWPSQLGGSGSAYRTGTLSGVNWVGWTCTVSGKKQVWGVVGLTTFMVTHPNTANMSPTRTAIAYWIANVGDPSQPLLAPGWIAMRAALK